MGKIKASMRRINYHLYAALLLLGLCPTIYTTVRIFFLGQLPNEWAYSIAGQLGWVNLLYEIMNEAILLPLFFFAGQVIRDRTAFANRVRSGLLMTLCIYTAFSGVIILAAEPLLDWMAANGSILQASATYIRIESVANIFGMLASFLLVALISLNREKYIYILTIVRLILSLLSDTFLVSTLPCSLNLGVNGIGWSNILVNAVLLMVSALLLRQEDIRIFSKEKLFSLVLLLLGFYVLYAFRNVFDATFYAMSKTNYHRIGAVPAERIIRQGLFFIGLLCKYGLGHMESREIKKQAER